MCLLEKWKEYLCIHNRVSRVNLKERKRKKSYCLYYKKEFFFLKIMFLVVLFPQTSHARGRTFTSVPNSLLFLVAYTNFYKHGGDLRSLISLLTFLEDFSSPSINGRLSRISLKWVGPVCATSCRNYSNTLACGRSYFLFPVQI